MSEPRYPFVHLEVATDDVELATDRFWELGAAGVEERDESTMNGSSGPGRTLLVASFADEESAQSVAAEVGGEVQVIVGDAWRDAWKEHFQITPIGDRLLLQVGVHRCKIVEMALAELAGVVPAQRLSGPHRDRPVVGELLGQQPDGRPVDVSVVDDGVFVVETGTVVETVRFWTEGGVWQTNHTTKAMT